MGAGPEQIGGKPKNKQSKHGTAERRGKVSEKALLLEELPWRCFHCDEVFADYQEARKHFGNIPSATPRCVLKKCLCLDCPCNPIECEGRSQFGTTERRGESE